VSVEQLQKLACWPVKWDWVRSRSQAVKCIFAVVICDKFAMEVILNLLAILLRVQTYEAY
jgi:hypothetical protein